MKLHIETERYTDDGIYVSVTRHETGLEVIKLEIYSAFSCCVVLPDGGYILMVDSGTSHLSPFVLSPFNKQSVSFLGVWFWVN